MGGAAIRHLCADHSAGVVLSEEQRLVQKFVAHLRIEGSPDAVLRRLPRRDKVPRHACLIAPGRHRARVELGARLAADQASLAAPGDQHRQLPRDVAS